MLERDKEEIEKLVEQRIGHWQDYVARVERQLMYHALGLVNRDTIMEKREWGQGKVEYYQGLLERVRAEKSVLRTEQSSQEG